MTPRRRSDVYSPSRSKSQGGRQTFAIADRAFRGFAQIRAGKLPSRSVTFTTPITQHISGGWGCRAIRWISATVNSRPISDRSGPLAPPRPCAVWHCSAPPLPKKMCAPAEASPAGRHLERSGIQRSHEASHGLKLACGSGKSGMPPWPFLITSAISFSLLLRSLRLLASAGPRSVPAALSPWQSAQVRSNWPRAEAAAAVSGPLLRAAGRADIAKATSAAREKALLARTLYARRYGFKYSLSASRTTFFPASSRGGFLRSVSHSLAYSGMLRFL